ncbi:capsular polysaccharide synthesis protein [Levilactobacillus acidifarinae]|uniref:Cps1A protein n=1 Tax=Levilactobacillus acidifarinae DSM 19394 = JCM 15949 TaxID=1423715 RepID=A0A0R1LPT3_9LACO|nr:capsular polysaccharide synthesis protein [Levilactobacillus acidifarinae]KRK95124.1 cps1A protein [Levilactobacillus acidifarinae DSM 19394]GEO70623.1 polysaccharide biosynthesis protein [Levilactobacillus acidifarinae]
MNKVLKIIKKFYLDSRYFSFHLAMLHFQETLSRYTPYKMAVNAHLKKDEIILNYLRKRYPVDFVRGKQNDRVDDSKIWVFWYQGKSAMPEVVRTTFNSIIENSNNHEVVLLTGQNVGKYIDIPIVIQEKVENKSVTLTEYSDIIRACILARYGGLWLDATVLVTRLIPDEIFKKSFFTIKNLEDERDPLFYISVSHLRWTTYVMGGKANNELFLYLADALVKYNSDESALIDYLLLDYFIEIGYEKIPFFKKSLDELSVSNSEKEELVLRMNATFPDSKTQRLLKSDTYMFKLTYKVKKNKSIKSLTNYDLLNRHLFLNVYRNEEN